MIVSDATIWSTFTSVIYDRYDSVQYFMIVSYAPNLALALANVINYDCEWCHNLEQFTIISYAPNLALALASVDKYDWKLCNNLEYHFLTMLEA